jgi:hypothetical protein
LTPANLGLLDLSHRGDVGGLPAGREHVLLLLLLWLELPRVRLVMQELRLDLGKGGTGLNWC